MSDFAERLRKLRDDAQLTQDQLATKSGMPVATIRGYEQGRREPYWHVVPKLAAALGVDCTAFADCEDMKAADEKPAGKKAKGKRGGK